MEKAVQHMGPTRVTVFNFGGVDFIFHNVKNEGSLTVYTNREGKIVGISPYVPGQNPVAVTDGLAWDVSSEGIVLT